jgi:hypothetical protein
LNFSDYKKSFLLTPTAQLYGPLYGPYDSICISQSA